ncbi:MAG: hypothetical protein HY664_00595 [Chloroflexi bacterium]|nr:hypothetical protein [Chloroflexota bacterium]
MNYRRQKPSERVEKPMKLPAGMATALVVAFLMMGAVANACSRSGEDGASSSPQPTPTPTAVPTPSPDMVKEPAPIENIAIVVAESFPPQYSLRVEFGLRNGCIQPGGYTVERKGDTIWVIVSVLRPADANVICTQQYEIASYNISLGSNYTPGKTYTVKVNDVTKAFIAQ